MSSSAAMPRSDNSNHLQALSPARNDPTLQNMSELESLLHQTLAQCNKLAKSETTHLTHDIAAAKMLNYCVRMLHADGWHPPTIVRAMVLREGGLDKGMRGTMYHALRERRNEIEAYHLQRTMVPEGERGALPVYSTPSPVMGQLYSGPLRHYRNHHDCYRGQCNGGGSNGVDVGRRADGVKDKHASVVTEKEEDDEGRVEDISLI